VPPSENSLNEAMPYFYTWCGLSANLECRFHICCTLLARNTGCTQKWRKKITICAPSRNFVRYIFATKACVDNRKELVEQQYLLQTSSQYGEVWPTNGWDLLASFWHPSKFQQVSHLGFVTAATLLTASQPNFARCLAISWADTLYIFLGEGGLGGHHVGHQPTF